MSKLNTAQIKELIVKHLENNPLSLTEAIIPVSDSGAEFCVKHWSRTSKRLSADKKLNFRVFECWVGWNQLRASVVTANPEDDEVIELVVEQVMW